MPDHDGRPPRACERADASAPARERASRDAERVESHDDTEASADEPSCSPSWSVVSLSELTSRASSPSDVCSSSVVAAAALASCATSASAGELAALAAREEAEERALFSNRPPSFRGRATEKKKAASEKTADASRMMTVADSSLKRAPPASETFDAAFEAPPAPKEAPQGPPPRAADDGLARRLIARLRAATASRLHALARAIEAEAAAARPRRRANEEKERRGDEDPTFRRFRDDTCIVRALSEAIVSLERFTRRALAALKEAARHGRTASCRVVTKYSVTRERFSALTNAFEERFFFFSGRGELRRGFFPTGRRFSDETKKKKSDVFRGERDLRWLAAAAALAPLAPAALWVAFSSACSKRT